LAAPSGIAVDAVGNIFIADRDNFRIRRLSIPLVVTIGTASPLPSGIAGVSYSQTLLAVGGTAPYAWWVESGSLPPGLTLGDSTGALNGTPTVAGTFTFLVRATDSARAFANRQYTLTINPAPSVVTIGTASPLPSGMAGVSYSQTLVAAGGTAPYAWGVESGSLPPGLTLGDSTGALNGTPAAAGTFTFLVRVTDSARAFANRQYTLTIDPAPAVRMAGFSGTIGPVQQPTVQVTLDQAYTDDVSGTVSLSFLPDVVNGATGATDVMFSSGGRSENFTIPRGGTSASIRLQTGTVSGLITLSFSALQAGGVNLVRPAAITGRIGRSAPVIVAACFSPAPSGFLVVVTGYSTPREVTAANFRLTAPAGAGLQGATQSLGEAQTLFTTWWGGRNQRRWGASSV